MLGDGRIPSCSAYDIFDGKRIVGEGARALERGNARWTMRRAISRRATRAGNAATNILNFALAVDEVVPGFVAQETLLYSPELKFYSNRVKMDERFLTSVCDLMCLGDSSGWTRGFRDAQRGHGLASRACRGRGAEQAGRIPYAVCMTLDLCFYAINHASVSQARRRFWGMMCLVETGGGSVGGETRATDTL